MIFLSISHSSYIEIDLPAELVMEQEEIDDFTDAAKHKAKETQEEETQEEEPRKKKPRKKNTRKVNFLFKLFDCFLDWQYLSKTNIS